METNQPVELKFRLTLQDYLAWGKYFRSSRKDNLPKFVRQMVLTLLMIALFVTCDQLRMPGILLAIVATSVFWVMWAICFTRWTQKRLFEPDGYMLSEKTYRLEEEGLRVVNTQTDTLHKWTGIQAIEQSPQHVFVKVDRSIAIVFPRAI